MLSLAKPEHYYQASPYYLCSTFNSKIILLQVFLAQGLGVGLGSSLSYVPSLAVLAQHFPSPHGRARAMGIAVAGSSIGGLVHPILINRLLHQGTEDTQKAFARGTRASAGLITGMQVIAVLLLRTKYPKKKEAEDEVEKKSKKLWPMLKEFSADWGYVHFVIG